MKIVLTLKKITTTFFWKELEFHDLIRRKRSTKKESMSIAWANISIIRINDSIFFYEDQLIFKALTFADSLMIVINCLLSDSTIRLISFASMPPISNSPMAIFEKYVSIYFFKVSKLPVLLFFELRTTFYMISSISF